MFPEIRALMDKENCTDAQVFLERNPNIRNKRSQIFIPIDESSEPLIELPDSFLRWSPHVYQKLGAPYSHYSPFYLRQGIFEALVKAQNHLSQNHPEYQLIIFDGYRPLAVQQFMVDHTFNNLSGGRVVSDEERSVIMDKVLTFWSLPSHDKKTPPPHSTGAAVDLTIVDSTGQPLDMGGDIDDIETALPNIYRNTPDMVNAHQNRELLNDVMSKAGFTRLPHEWWHFSIGDQWAEFIQCLNDPSHRPVARYGRYE